MEFINSIRLEFIKKMIIFQDGEEIDVFDKSQVMRQFRKEICHLFLRIYLKLKQLWFR